MRTISFFGAAETVTGSRHLITVGESRILVDCGLFQGNRETRQRNWEPFPVDPASIDALVVTHAHIDHIGWIPRLVDQGFNGPIYATAATISLAGLSLPDSARLQEEEAYHSNKHGSRHEPALPLYTEEMALRCLKQFRPVRYDSASPLPGGVSFRFLPAGHILGSAFAELTFDDGVKLLMSGDLGRYNTPIIRDPAVVESADYLVVESTYGNRVHAHEDVEGKLGHVLADAWENGNTVIVPSFSIGRTQELLYYMSRLQNAGKMPRIPVYVDSPMASLATRIYASAQEEHDEEMTLSLKLKRSELEPEGVQSIRDAEQSKELNSRKGPLVIIAGSGMANGGRVVHHLFHRLCDPKTVVLFTGYQAEGTLGRRLVDGEKTVRIFRQEISVAARIEKLNSLSAHADSNEILQWLGNFKSPPKRTFIVHGEPPAQAALQERIQRELGWTSSIPHQGEEFRLD